MDMEQEKRTGSIVLIDILEMRRACLLSALEPWARNAAFDLISYAPDDIHRLNDDYGDLIRLVIINMGGASLSDHKQQELLMAVKTAFKGPYAVISDRHDPNDAVVVAGLGFQAFLPAALPLDIVKRALSFIIHGGIYFPPEAFLASLSASVTPSASLHHRSSEAPATLTQRQREVLERLRFGKSNKHIARELNMQEATVKVHVRQIMRKLGATNRTQAALLAQSTMRLSGSGLASDHVFNEIPPDLLGSLSTQERMAAVPPRG
ncbi:response regulator transcription factor [Neorhizobium sp. Rsf11]|uniref:Response regulator transcription factor n=1 Tax=Neorhizobium phenanthreniclasticum TaxID=3157917 RepID=A0ABV0M7P0_9HYPH